MAATTSPRWTIFFNPFIETEYQGVLTAQRSAMDTMLRDPDSAAQEFVSAYRTRRDTGNGNLPDIESRIQKAANRYEETVQKALPADNAETERREQLKSYLTTYGWVAPGCLVPDLCHRQPATGRPGQPRSYCEWRLVTGRSRGYGVPEGSQRSLPGTVAELSVYSCTGNRHLCQ